MDSSNKPGVKTARTGAPLGGGAGGQTSHGEWGAPPSNTAPPNSTASLPDGFRLLRLAVDSLYLSFPGDLFPSVESRLKELKTKAQSEHLEQQALAQYPVGAHIFEVKDKGAGLYPYVMDDAAYRIQLSRPGKRLPMAYVKVSAHFLAHAGPLEALRELRDILSQLGELNGSNVVSRIDLAADFLSPCVMDSWSRAAWVTRASRIDQHSANQHFTGWSIGMGGVIGARLYDKTKEIEFSGKHWNKELWRPVGWQEDQEVWRLEFEFKRDFLKEYSLSSLESVLENLNGLWSYATTEWLRLTLPNDADATRSRWPTHDLWVALASLDWNGEEPVRLNRFSNRRAPDEQRLAAFVVGSLVSIMASHRLDTREEALDILLERMHEKIRKDAEYAGLDEHSYLVRRARAKARTFNSNDNTHGLPADEPPGVTAYRKASRGE